MGQNSAVKYYPAPLFALQTLILQDIPRSLKTKKDAFHRRDKNRKTESALRQPFANEYALQALV